MIKSIHHRGLRILYENGKPRGVPAAFERKLRQILAALDRGNLPMAADLPGFGLHPLTGDREGTWSIVVSRNWRVTFKISGPDAMDVDLEDYH